MSCAYRILGSSFLEGVGFTGAGKRRVEEVDSTRLALSRKMEREEESCKTDKVEKNENEEKERYGGS